MTQAVARNDSQERLELEIAMLRQRLEDAEEMRRAITEGEIDALVVGKDEKEVLLLSTAYQRYRQMVERMRDGAATVSRTGDLLYANVRFAAMLGEPLSRLFSVQLQEFVAPEDSDRLAAFLSAAIPNSVLQISFARNDGTRVPAQLTVTSFGEGHASLLIADLSANERLHEAEEALQAIRNGEIDGVVIGGDAVMLLGTAHRPYQAIMDRIQQGAVTASSEGDVLYANERFAAMIGVPREALLGTRLAERLLAEDRAAFTRLLQEGSAGSVHCEINLVRAGGEPLPALVTAAPLEESDALCLVVTDLTEQRRHLEILEADRHKDEFLAILAHELRNPLAPIRNAVEILNRTPSLDPNARYAVDVINRQTATMARLVDDLLDINRLNQGKIDLKSERVDLSEVLAGAVEAVRPLLQERNHRLEVDLPKQPLNVIGDPMRLTQVVLNLLSNAAKYTPPGGQVSVALRRDGEQALITVADTGIGIPPERISQIFEPFTQVSHPGQQTGGGLGLGLTLSRRLVQLHGGSIEAHSEGKDRGTLIAVRLPLAR